MRQVLWFLAAGKHPPGPERVGVGGCGRPSARRRGRARGILNLSFVFLLAKFTASWRAGGLRTGGRKGHLRQEDEKKPLAIPGEAGFCARVVM